MKSDRELAEIGLAHFKKAIQESNLNYFLSESPFSLNVNIRKTLISRYSLDSSTPLKPPFVQTTLNNVHSEENVSTNSSVFLLQNYGQTDDSGINSEQMECKPCQNVKEQLEDVQK